MAIEQKISEYVMYIVYFIFLYYSIYWLIVLATYKKVNERRVVIRDYPGVTIAVPVYNEQNTVTLTVDSLFALDYPKDKLTVICVNDGSTDNTADILKKLKQKYKDRNFSIINQKNKGKYAAVNEALARTKTPYFGCLDADSYVDKNTLKLLIADFFTDPGLSATMPIMKVQSRKNWIEKIQNIEYMTSVFLKKLHETRDCINVTPGPFSIFKTSAIVSVGNYRKAHMTEDLELALRMQQSNHLMHQNTSAVVYTKTPRTLKGYYRQRLRWNRGTFLNSWDYRHMLFNPKYGDLGFIQLPMVATSGAFAALIFCLLLINQIRPLYTSIKTWFLSGFDLITYLRTLHIETNLLLLNVFFATLTVVMFTVMLVYVYNSIRVSKESFSSRYFSSVLFYFYLYGLVNSAIWFMTFVDIVLKRKERWHK